MLGVISTALSPRPARAAPDAAGRGAARGDGVVTLALCGDVMTGRGIDQVLPHPCDPRLCERYVTSATGYVALAERANGAIPAPVDLAYVWGDALTALERRRPDALVVNLETAVTTAPDCVPKGINYKMNPRNVGCLTAAGIDCCVLANNHVLDWGEAGLLETLEALESAGLATAGAGRDADAAAAPAIIEVPGKGRVVVFAFGAGSSGIPPDWAAGRDRPGVDRLDELSSAAVDRIAERVGAVRRRGDVVVASLHWGGNWGYEVPEAQSGFARGLIERAGIDVVHGHSAHHAKAIEVRGGKPILYGCGDFLNDYEGIGGYEAFRDDLAVMYVLDLDISSGALAGLDLVPFRIRRFRLERASAADARWLRRTLSREGKSFGTRVETGAGGSLTLRWG